MKILTDIKQLKKGVEHSDLTQERINEVSVILEKKLEKLNAYGLSTNQIGLKERVCIVNVKEPIVMVNPKVVKVSPNKIVYTEQCLSIPKTMKKAKRVVRYTNFSVECDNLGLVEFSPDKTDWKGSDDYFSDEGLLESVVAQHQVDLLNGILITDSNRRYNSTFVNKKSYGRNERVMVRMDNGDTEFMKYKYAKRMKDVEIL